jgi:hypothetical protein
VREKVLFSRTDFLPWEILLIKKLDFEKTKPTSYSTFKTDITKVGLVFSISNFFINKISQGRKSVRGLAAANYLYSHTYTKFSVAITGPSIMEHMPGI